jgi:hypothetical protein
MSNNYWVVGAMFGGKDDVLDEFIKRGYWYCWDKNSNNIDVSPQVIAMQNLFLQIVEGDRIAVKKLLGQGATEIEIRAIGIVKAKDEEEWRVYVDWLPLGESFAKKIARRVDFKGAGSSIHGPYTNDNPWIRQIFCV